MTLSNHEKTTDRDAAAAVVPAGDIVSEDKFAETCWMHNNLKKYIILLFVACLPLLSACATVSRPPAADRLVAYGVLKTDTLLGRQAPVFLVENNSAAYNRIGTPQAAIAEDSKEKIRVDPGRATFYARQQAFTTPGGTYTNLVYRVHFAEVPGGWAPFHLIAGKNVGLLVIITLNDRQQPLLVTTVHTCGCYLAFVPTAYLPVDAWPAGWQKGRQAVYGENLPGFLDDAGLPPERIRPVIVLRDGTHRVKDIRWADTGTSGDTAVVTAELKPLDVLERLPLEEVGTTSFYESSGSRGGYVKESYKRRERLLMSWWALDWRVGEDKKFGLDKTDGIEFYTSLKPWARSASDMRDFAAFLKYWGWGL